LSTQAEIKGDFACLNGYLLQIKVPACSETGNVKSYFSGHYQTYITNAGLFMLQLQHLEEQMTLQHLKKQNSFK